MALFAIQVLRLPNVGCQGSKRTLDDFLNTQSRRFASSELPVRFEAWLPTLVPEDEGLQTFAGH
jgi:hypothetical protein